MNYPKSYDGTKIHFSMEDLERLEKAARSMSRMDLTDKMKLINQSRFAKSLEERLEAMERAGSEQAKRADQNQADMLRYREALEWYANPSNWEPTINGVDIPVELDQGKTARKALKGR